MELRFIGPSRNRGKAVNALNHLGFVDATDSVPWREVFAEYADERMPGIILSGLRYREGLTQKQLSEMTGIPQSNISGMERGRRSIGKDRAKRLAAALNADYRILL